MLAPLSLADRLPVRHPPEATALSHHGGNLAAARLHFPDAPEPWIDLSTGINPLAYPVEDLPAAIWRRLPDAAAQRQLEIVAGKSFDVPASVEVVAAPGTQSLIQILPRLLPARRVAILGFGYQEHPASWRAAGAEVVVVDDLRHLEEADVAVVVNPNNPDGRHVAPADLVALSLRLAQRGGTLVVDEAFMDVHEPEASLLPYLPPEGAVVLRSFGKFFGLGGLRLGFAVANPALAAAIRAQLGAWAVSGPAIAIGTRALGDRAWQAETRVALHAAASRLDRCLAAAGFAVVGGTCLFRLTARPDAAAWFGRLGRAGILVRPFAAEPTWLRFGLPADEAGWARLDTVLRP
ncbi:threonine-phosphate decarboxylase CobD [Lichenifustis flavocetrariae]|uniref:threonine-phosphate decarboxylase n=1 Tax=Lichenifustis flavocetrariae TaxID=2949735 RepID=A0AA42CN87_9HYPH|nr:threonine-phosphate decarboxylase CobD [Lichenifustis flavocetrariae]MCW6512481.1 threonine-phosphate decarboxylase CobD [Lichenifustis flavocetrariae]